MNYSDNFSECRSLINEYNAYGNDIDCKYMVNTQLIELYYIKFVKKSNQPSFKQLITYRKQMQSKTKPLLPQYSER